MPVSQPPVRRLDSSRCRHAQIAGLAAFLLAVLALMPGQASSHREAPFVTKHPKVDATDFYAFNSYETGRTGSSR